MVILIKCKKITFKFVNEKNGGVRKDGRCKIKADISRYIDKGVAEKMSYKTSHVKFLRETNENATTGRVFIWTFRNFYCTFVMKMHQEYETFGRMQMEFLPELMHMF